MENKENQRQIYNSFPSLFIRSWTFKNKVKLFGSLTPFKMLTSKYLYSLVERTKGARKVINHVRADNGLSGSCNQTAIGWLGRATLVERESARRAGVTSTSPPRIPPCLTVSVVVGSCEGWAVHSERDDILTSRWFYTGTNSCWREYRRLTF